MAFMVMWKERIRKALEQQRLDDRYRQRVVCHAQGSSINIEVEEATYLNFSSNDYLGLAHHPQLVLAAAYGAEHYGVGSGGSPHVTGFSRPLALLEERLADWLGYEAAIVYPSGFTANQAVIKVLIEKGDLIIADRLSHASLMEAAILSPGRLHRFKHNDLQSLESYLERYSVSSFDPSSDASSLDTSSLPTPLKTPLKLVVTEGLFSMDGDGAPLGEIAKVAANYGALLMVDDAHGIGIIGDEGRGSCDQAGIKPDILIVTFGKALGCSGAAVLLSDELAEYFTQFSRPLIYSTAIPPMQAEILNEAITLIRSDEGEQRREKLAANIAYFRTRMGDMLATLKERFSRDFTLSPGINEFNALPFPYLIPSESAIQPLVIGEDSVALKLSRLLKNHGIWVSAIRPPTVPPKSARLRITITAEHQQSMIDYLIDQLEESLIILLTQQNDEAVGVLDV